MQMRTIESLGVTVSRLGFGAMRLPGVNGDIDYKDAEKLIDIMMDAGVNYFDTAWFYHDGRSEPFLKKALVDRYPRDSFFLATKSPTFQCKNRAELEEIFDEQRRRTGVDFFDFYLLHGLSEKNWADAKAIDAPAFLRDRKASGQIRFTGFSYHDANEKLAPILDDFEWQFCQIQLNYADWKQEKAYELYNAVFERGIPIIVMEPVRGGGLAALYPDMANILKAVNPDATPASFAFRFCCDLPGVDIVLSGMSTPVQCLDNVKTFSEAKPLSEAERAALDAVVDGMAKRPYIPCTACRYCSDCPQGIDIPALFGAYNDHIGLKANYLLAVEYLLRTPPEKHATACIRCGQCEERCPQGIAIMDNIQLAHDAAEAADKGALR